MDLETVTGSSAPFSLKTTSSLFTTTGLLPHRLISFDSKCHGHHIAFEIENSPKEYSSTTYVSQGNPVQGNERSLKLYVVGHDGTEQSVERVTGRLIGIDHQRLLLGPWLDCEHGGLDPARTEKLGLRQLVNNRDDLAHLIASYLIHQPSAVHVRLVGLEHWFALDPDLRLGTSDSEFSIRCLFDGKVVQVARRTSPSRHSLFPREHRPEEQLALSDQVAIEPQEPEIEEVEHVDMIAADEAAALPGTFWDTWISWKKDPKCANRVLSIPESQKTNKQHLRLSLTKTFFMWSRSSPESQVEQVEHADTDPPAIIPADEAAALQREYWSTWIKRLEFAQWTFPSLDCEEDLIDVSSTSSDAGQDAMQGSCKELAPWEKVFLLTYRDWNDACVDALHHGAHMEHVRETTRLYGQAGQLLEHGGASIFVSADVHSTVVRALQGQKLGKHHIIISEYLMPFLHAELDDLRLRTGFNSRLRRTQTLTYAMDAMRLVVKNFGFDLQLACDEADRFTVSTGPMQCNPRRKALLAEALAFPGVDPCCPEVEPEMEPEMRSTRDGARDVEHQSNGKYDCNASSLPQEPELEEVQPLHASYEDICSHLEEHAKLNEEDFVTSDRLLSLLTSAFDFVIRMQGPCLLVLISRQAKHAIQWSALDGGYMNGKTQGKQFTSILDSLERFVEKPCPTEPGFKADCWSLQHPDVGARGKPKDGAAAVVGFTGAVYFSAAQINHMPQRFCMEGGCRHRAAVGTTEWLSNEGHRGVVFVRSESGRVCVLTPGTSSESLDVRRLDM